MAPGHVALAWAPGERLLTTSEHSPECAVDVVPTLPPPVLRMYFSGHRCFILPDKDPSALSKIYVSLIDVCIENLLDPVDDHQSLAEHFREVRAVWSLIDAVYFPAESDPYKHISYALRPWYFENFSPEKACYQSHDYHSLSEEKAWEYLSDLVLCGDIPGANRFLTQVIQTMDVSHTEWQQTIAFVRLGQFDKVPEDIPVMCLVHAVLDAAPLQHRSPGTDKSWSEWQSVCEAWSQSAKIDASENAKKVLLIMTGDPVSISASCESWEQALVATSTYIPMHNLTGEQIHCSSALADVGIVASTMKDPSSLAGGALVEAAMGKFKEVIVRLDTVLPTSWVSAHLCDVLVRAKLLKDELNSTPLGHSCASVPAREFFLRRYATSLERYPACWRIAVDYLCACETHGTAALMDMVNRLPFSGCGDRVIEKAIHACNRKRLTGTIKRLCQRVGVKCIHNRDFGGAMAWFCRAGCPEKCCEVADAALRLAEMEGPGSDGAKELERTAEAILTYGNDELREKVHFAVSYYHMQKAKFELLPDVPQDGSMKSKIVRFEDAVDDLICSQMLYRRFWCVIGYEGAQILEAYGDMSVFSRKTLSQLIMAVEVASGPYRDDELLGGIRRRIAQDALSLKDSQGIVEPCSVERADRELDRCRKVFLESLARKINETHED